MERVTGTIISLDLGIATGFAFGKPGDAPASGTVLLKNKKETRDVAYANLIAFLADLFTKEKPELVVKEKILALEAFKQLNMSQDVVYAHAGYHAVVEGICVRFGIACDDVADSTARKHFIGIGRLGEREDTKDAVKRRCHQLGLMPRDCDDDNRADALCIHDWACANYGSKSMSIQNFQFFEEGGGKRK